MSVLPFTSNVTCDIYRVANNPPAAPNVAGVKIFLSADYARDHDKAISSQTVMRWTHQALLPLNTDIRDDYRFSLSGSGTSTNEDKVYVPDKNGTEFLVIFVERINRGTTQDCLRAYLQRQPPTWPTQQL
jgi:hypothetical protein